MPVISIDVAPISPEKKEELIRSCTRIASEILDIPQQSFTVLIKEYPRDAIGVGGNPLSQMGKI